MRKVIQIISDGTPGEITALCDDGSLWFYVPDAGIYAPHVYWKKLVDIPQDQAHRESNQ